jgi:hypothetical protein
MQIRIRNLVNPGSGIGDGKMRFGILDAGETSQILNTD